MHSLLLIEHFFWNIKLKKNLWSDTKYRKVFVNFWLKKLRTIRAFSNFCIMSSSLNNLLVRRFFTCSTYRLVNNIFVDLYVLLFAITWKESMKAFTCRDLFNNSHDFDMCALIAAYNKSVRLRLFFSLQQQYKRLPELWIFRIVPIIQ